MLYLGLMHGLFDHKPLKRCSPDYFPTASLFPDPGTSFSKPRAILNLNFLVLFFLTAILA